MPVVTPRKAPSDHIDWDPEVTGLGQRIRPGRKPTWIAQWRQGTVTIRRSLGPVSRMTRPQARDAAQKLMPISQEEFVTVASSPSFAAFAETFLRDCAGRWKPQTQYAHRKGLLNRLMPTFGEQHVDTLKRPDIRLWLAGPQGCNRALSVLSSLMQHAEVLGIRPVGSNPCRGLRRRQSGFKARYPSSTDYARLGPALERLSQHHPIEAQALRFLALTGARKSEALSLRWSHLESARAVLPDSKTGPKTLWLSPSVQKLLETVRTLQCESHRKPHCTSHGKSHYDSYSKRYVFAYADHRVSRHALSDCWTIVRKDAGLPPLRLHDLRHGYASVAVAHGEDLATVARLLGHADFATTLGYAHLADAPLIAAAQRVSTQLSGALQRHDAVVPLRPRKRQRTAFRPTSPEQASHWQQLVALYRSKPEPLSSFCTQHGIDPEQFRAAIQQARAQRSQALAVSP